MVKLAMFGGPRTLTKSSVPPEHIRWPVVTDAEDAAVAGVLKSGSFASASAKRGEVALLEEEWARFVGVPHCAAVSNGTAAIELALAAAGLEPGAEVLVPALSFIASAVAPVQRMLIPVFCDIDPVTYTISPQAAEAAITSRTQAIIAVHLHGLPCDMDELRALADRHHLLLIEDAAQAHGARYRGVRTGALGDIATFSLNVTKNLPTCGEGGLVTTASESLHRAVVRYRQFGEDIGPDRDYVSRLLAGNEKLSAVQAAFTRCQLDRLQDSDQARDLNVRAMLGQLNDLQGLGLPCCPGDRTHAWHILRFRFDPADIGCPDVEPGALREVLMRALRGEGVPVKQYQSMPLPAQQAFTRREGFGGYPWKLSPAAPACWQPEDFPATTQVIEDSLTLQHWHLNPASGPVLLRCAEAFAKVWDNLGALAQVARGIDYTPAWQQAARVGG